MSEQVALAGVARAVLLIFGSSGPTGREVRPVHSVAVDAVDSRLERV